MTLEPALLELDEAENPERVDFKRRFWWTLPLTAIATVLAMFGHRLGGFDMARQSWLELALALPNQFDSGSGIGVRGTVGGKALALGNPALMEQLGIDLSPLATEAEALLGDFHPGPGGSARRAAPAAHCAVVAACRRVVGGLAQSCNRGPGPGARPAAALMGGLVVASWSLRFVFQRTEEGRPMRRH